MYKNKKVLLIAGGGTLGSHTASELLKNGSEVDIVCLDDHISENSRLRFFKGLATPELLSKLFSENRYDGIVNFIHYKNADDYRPYHELLIKNTDHLIFLSSYRVYADLQHPITESAPRLFDVTEDKEFLENETYAISKAKAENILREEYSCDAWTVVRPVISFSKKRFDLFTYSGDDVFEAIRLGKPLLLPSFAKGLGAGIDWSGNSGKLIANLLFKNEAIGEAYTISSAENFTWGEVAEMYSDAIGLRVEWCDENHFIEANPCIVDAKKWIYLYDRKFDRIIDNSKVLFETGLPPSDLTPMAEGLLYELRLAGRI